MITTHPRALALCLALACLAAGAEAADTSPLGTRAPGAHGVDKQPKLQTETVSLAEGAWRGAWSGSDYMYDAEMVLDVDADGDVAGQIAWTLRASPLADEQEKVGLSAIEYVHGAYVADAGSLTLEGYDREDPHELIGYDSYRLVVSENQSLMVGLTGNNGSWDGFLTMRR